MLANSAAKCHGERPALTLLGVLQTGHLRAVATRNNPPREEESSLTLAQTRLDRIISMPATRCRLFQICACHELLRSGTQLELS